MQIWTDTLIYVPLPFGTHSGGESSASSIEPCVRCFPRGIVRIEPFAIEVSYAVSDIALARRDGPAHRITSEEANRAFHDANVNLLRETETLRAFADEEIFKMFLNAAASARELRRLDDRAGHAPDEEQWDEVHKTFSGFGSELEQWLHRERRRWQRSSRGSGQG
jgi:hypothetical protein